jgi:hypothetical protein
MSTFFNAVRTFEGEVHVLTKARWMLLVPMPHTSIVPHRIADLRLGTMIRWTTNDRATLLELHTAIVRVVEQLSLTGIIEIVEQLKVTMEAARCTGADWRCTVAEEFAQSSEGVSFSLPNGVLRHIKALV